MVAVPVVHHVRLNMRANAPARGFDGVVANATDLPGLLVPLTRTCGWSDAPHVASTAYYREFAIPKNLEDHRGGRRKFMEESVHYPMQRNGMKGGCYETRKRVEAGEVRPLAAAESHRSPSRQLEGARVRTRRLCAVPRRVGPAARPAPVGAVGREGVRTRWVWPFVEERVQPSGRITLSS